MSSRINAIRSKVENHQAVDNEDVAWLLREYDDEVRKLGDVRATIVRILNQVMTDYKAHSGSDKNIDLL